MRTILTLILLIGSLQLVYQQDREVVKWTFLETNIEDIDTIVRLKPYLLEVDFTDTLYIANSIYINKLNEFKSSYDTLRVAVEENLPEAQMILNSELTLGLNKLSDNVGILEKKYELSLTENIRNTEVLRQENYLIKQNLNRSLEELGKAKQKIRNERWNKLASKMLWGAGGLLIGGTLIALNN